MKIYKATKVDEKEYQTLVDLHGTDGKLEAGMIVSDNKSYFWVTTLDGLISVDELQLAGKKRMPVKDFLIGFRDPMSYKLSKGSSHEIIANAK
jgi:methionyl-tRNA formyltransferase